MNTFLKLNSKNLKTTAYVAIRVALQGLFFLMLPKLLDVKIVSTAYFVFSLSSITPSIASLGSQFGIIKTLAEKKDNLFGYYKLYLLGSINLFVVSIALFLIYKDSGVSFGLIDLFVYMFACYFRLFADSHYQGLGKFNLMQRYYIIFWFAKILFIAVIYLARLQISFIYLSFFEMIASLPWIVFSVISLWKSSGNLRYASYSIKEGLTRTLGGLSRNLWLEADKILLPLYLDSHIYVQYSLISRVFSAAIIFISSFIASITPKIITSSKNELRDVISSGKLTVLISCFAFLFGTIASFVLYKLFSLENLFVSLCFFASIPLFYWGSIVFDFIFYHSKTFNRVLLNLLGLAIICAGIFFSFRSKNLYPISFSITMSYVITLFTAQFISSKERL